MTLTVQSVLETLMMQRRNTIGCHGVEFGSDMPPTAEQAMIPDLLRPVPGKEEKAAAA